MARVSRVIDVSSNSIVEFNLYFYNCSLFAGLLPRVAWITCGGAIFFGFYNFTTDLMMKEKR